MNSVSCAVLLFLCLSWARMHVWVVGDSACACAWVHIHEVYLLQCWLACPLACWLLACLLIPSDDNLIPIDPELILTDPYWSHSGPFHPCWSILIPIDPFFIPADPFWSFLIPINSSLLIHYFSSCAWVHIHESQCSHVGLRACLHVHSWLAYWSLLILIDPESVWGESFIEKLPWAPIHFC